ncbi:MAG: hypothetical protein ACI37O_05375 [Candidatus Avelusimicrobium sp.]|uniref:hypothetical protein n=1 Tax=Candidatus Avelusimicrobium sp. TaxID=3048833 RepID=UPI003F0C35B2
MFFKGYPKGCCLGFFDFKKTTDSRTLRVAPLRAAFLLGMTTKGNSSPEKWRRQADGNFHPTKTLRKQGLSYILFRPGLALSARFGAGRACTEHNKKPAFRRVLF